MSTNEIDNEEVLQFADSVLAEVDAEDGGADGFDMETQTLAMAAEDEGIDVHIDGVNGKPAYFRGDLTKPVTIGVYGVNSRAYKRAQAAIDRRKIRQGTLTVESLRDNELEKLVACTFRWSFVRKDKNAEADVRCDKANVEALYRRLPFVADKMMEAMKDHELFSKGS